MKHILFSVFVASATISAHAAATLPTYTELDLTSLVSNGMFVGNNGLADFNGDGNLDIFVCGRDLNQGWKTGAFWLSGDGYSFDTVHEFTNIYDYDSQIIPFDFDIDGDIDVIYTGYGGAKLFKNDGSGTFEQVDGFAIDNEMWLDGDTNETWFDGIFNIADFNHDGYPDILCMTNSNPTILINDSGAGTFTPIADAGIAPQRGGTTAVGDINGDGIQDVVVSGWNDTFGNDCFRAYIGKGDGTFTFNYANNDPFDLVNRGTEKGHIILVDIDSDGDLDLFITGTSCPIAWTSISEIWLNNGTGIFALDSSTTFTGVQKSGADWCDLNGDGTIDLVFAGEGSGATTHIVLNEGNGTYTTHTETVLGGHRGGATITAADFNSNGWIDIMVQGYNDAGSNHFQVANGIGNQRSMNVAPTAPTNLMAKTAEGKVSFSWEAGSDTKTPTAALRYNIYVKLIDGEIISVVPADPATGKLRSIEVGSALITCSYTLNIDAAKIAEWGVQTIDGGKLGSPFAVGEISAIENIEIDDNEAIEYYNIQGVKVENPQSGLYIKKQGNKATKVLVK